MNVTHRHFVLLAFLSIAVGTHVVAQKQDQFLAKQKKDAAQNPAAVSFVIQTRNNQTRFHQGELISLQLSFSSTQPEKYSIDSVTYDRSGRLDIDTFHVDPPGAVSDPLSDYFNSGFIFIGGGLRGITPLQSKPYVVTADLNEWYRFERPGKYRLYITSHRVRSDHFVDDQAQASVVTSPVTSNVIELEIVPADAAWATQTLAAAITTLDAKSSSESRRDAYRVLRFLGTTHAVKELVRRFDGSESDNWSELEIDFGLRGTQHRAVAIAEMENQIAASDFPVTNQFLSVLTFLSFLQQDAPPLPQMGQNESDEAISLSRKIFDRRNEIYDGILNSYRQRLLGSVLNKNKHARAISLETLLSTTTRPPASSIQDQGQKNLKRALAPIFFELPTATQQNLLEYRWPDIAGDEMLPILRRLFENGPKSSQMTSLALERIYELSPDEGRRLILDEVQRRDPRVNIHTLSLLPDETLPEVDAMVEERAGNDNVDSEVLLQLANRYASSAVAAKLKSTYEEKIGSFACAPQQALISYFLRVDPDSGLEYVRRALAARKSTGCYQTLLGDIAKKQMSPELEKIAISSLDDSDPQLLINAVEMLGNYGSQAARDPLLHRFEQWHEAWNGREKELVEQQRNDILNAQVRVEVALLRALANSTAWLADEEMLTKLTQLCVSRDCTSEANSIIKQFGPNITVFFDMRSSAVAHASISQYNVLSWDQLKTKVTQFPRGTTFTFGSDRPDTADEQSVVDELRTYLERYEMKLRKFDADKKVQ
jgi:hypothetical protein